MCFHTGKFDHNMIIYWKVYQQFVILHTISNVFSKITVSGTVSTVSLMSPYPGACKIPINVKLTGSKCYTSKVVLFIIIKPSFLFMLGFIFSVQHHKQILWKIWLHPRTVVNKCKDIGSLLMNTQATKKRTQNKPPWGNKFPLLYSYRAKTY